MNDREACSHEKTDDRSLMARYHLIEPWWQREIWHPRFPVRHMVCPQCQAAIGWWDWLLTLWSPPGSHPCGIDYDHWQERWLVWVPRWTWWKPWTWWRGLYVDAKPPR